MKVCTDSCLFGAWLANKFQSKNFRVSEVLDIGTGTGLLALMLAQKSTATFDAVEISAKAYEQALQNFAASPWCRRLHAIHADVNNLPPTKKYDLIISNPPFYEGDLQADDHHKNLARHHEGLSLKQLIAVTKTSLLSHGSFAVLLPFRRVDFFINAASESGFHLQEKVLVRPSPSADFIRGMLFFSLIPAELISHTITIRDRDNKYTTEFCNLLEAYYLNVRG